MWRKGNTLALFVKEKKVKVKSLSRVQHFVTPWTVAHQAPPSMGFSRQEYWNGLPFPSPGHLPDPGIKPDLLHLLHWQAGSANLGSPQESAKNIYW